MEPSSTSTSASASASNTEQEQEQDEEWIFSLFVPFDEEPVVRLITSHHAITSTMHRQQQQQQQHSSSRDDEETIPPIPAETKSLLPRDASANNNNNNNKTNTTQIESFPCCWKFTSPMGRILQSSILLRLTYRPAWQGIPEYTKNQGAIKQFSKRLLFGCCSVDSDAEIPQIVQETYTRQDIVKTKRTYVTIRGMGKCQALQVYLKPLLFNKDGDEHEHEHADNDDDDDNDNDDNDNDDDHIAVQHDDKQKQKQKPAPRALQFALDAHGQRMGQQQQQSQSKEEPPYSRFTEPEDSLPSRDNDDDYNIVITFAMPVQTELKYDPPLLWKVSLPKPTQNNSKNSGSGSGMLSLETITVLEGMVDLQEPATHTYIQGYQSWSFTGSISVTKNKAVPQPQPSLPNLFSKAFNLGGTVPNQRPTMILPVAANNKNRNIRSNSKNKANYYYKSDFFTCITTGRGEIMDEIGGPALLCGWLSQHEQFGLVELDDKLQHVAMHASHNAIINKTTVTDWAYAQLISPHHYDEEPMVHFLHAAAAYNQAKPLQNGPLLTGWCSWYHYYENISADNLRENFGKLASMKNKVPTNVAVVDDGYMTAWGDWDSFKPDKFSDMTVVCRDIQSHGMRPGLWLAPFACDKHSSIVKKHPEWIIRNDRGRPANSSNCGKFFYGLDATNPKVRAHAFEAIRRAVHDWGFTVLKIDFLYAACLVGNGKYDLSMTRAQAMHLALQTIRHAAGPDVFLIGCGCPMGTGIGYVDGMRISADTGPTWYPAFPLPWWDHGTLPALRAMIRNSMSRAPMGHRWWHNDPDCLLLGETTSLTNEEVASAASIVAMTCGMMLLSDDLTKVSIARMRILTKIFPMTGVSAIVLDLHTTTNKGMPSVLRLWCTDKYNSMNQFRSSTTFQQSLRDQNHNAEATHFGRQASFNHDEALPHPNERQRSCIHVARGLGTWTVISLSNWADTTQLMHIPRLAVEAPPKTGWGADGAETERNNNTADDNGYHVFSFWSGRYTWVSLVDNKDGSDGSNHCHNSGPLSRRLGPHETEIFHIRPVTPGMPQYVGSDLHFSCGHEVLSFDASQKNKVLIQLKTDLNRVGHIFLFVPTVDTSHVRILVAGQPGRWTVVGNTPKEGGPSHCCGRILRIMVVVHGNDSDQDGHIAVDY